MDLLILAQSSDAGGAIGGIIVLIIQLAILLVVFAGMWKVFSKAGEPGWAAIIPIYNLVVLVKIAGRPMWWVILFFVPIANLIAAVLVSIDVAKNFGKGTGFGLGLAFLGPIFYPMLGFGDAQFQGGGGY